ncbi:N-acetylmannosamine-6-phosphate 2-epimerase [Virgibacillus sp. NKC19-3]|uniref:N-acetylmannosamine-6-phosphate 2-epimerase n=1 Tax=Virgibacillus saliphilus TaxID=2831674 RepID=UPI001C9A80D5|nr:N-acetylmannosamine-6-phosphate 2-epimerase [Virgibacillus sp. NKC19-3]MBY7144488.1 N-acetylmannosamine-6-phosphate 2-epimerase [Virgibacillus sp. NKC19-3]
MSKKLIVSCQALKDEPLHSSYIMSKMALAASRGGARGIRANSVVDIQAIKKKVNLPLIGIIKQSYVDSDVVITPTITEVNALYEEGVDVIAFDATDRLRPSYQTFASFISEVKEQIPSQTLMADVSTVEEAINAEALGVDIVGTTLVGYTARSEDETSLNVLQEIVGKVNIPVVAEGNIDTPDKAKKAIELGACAVVVGSAITRPQYITEKFSEKIDGIDKSDKDYQ